MLGGATVSRKTLNCLNKYKLSNRLNKKICNLFLFSMKLSVGNDIANFLYASESLGLGIRDKFSLLQRYA